MFEFVSWTWLLNTFIGAMIAITLWECIAWVRRKLNPNDLFS